MRKALEFAFVIVAITLLLALAIAHAQRGLVRPIDRSRGQSIFTNGSARKTLVFQGTTRRYLLHVPPNANGALVLAFHGGGETPENLESVTGLSALADRERFIVAYPEGIAKSWADGRGTTAADKQGADDVGFAKAIVGAIAREYAVDRTRVFATGPSNGGIFSSRLGCDGADTFVAIAPVIGTIAETLASHCHPSAPVAVIGIQGVDDPVVPFGGGIVGGTLEGKAAGGPVLAARATQELWRSLDSCAPDVSESRVPIAMNDGTSVVRRAFGGCFHDVAVVWYEIQGGGHRWPPHHASGITEGMARRTLGASSQNIDATGVIWNFFAAHARKPH